jgi:hypothetical protein
MKIVALLFALVVLPRLVSAEEAWRWTDAHGTVCYTNRADVAPADAVQVTTRLQIAATRLPDSDEAVVVADNRSAAARVAKRPYRIYNDARRRFDCYAGGVLYAGGWAHADDISGVGNCLPYMLGPEAWLNSARAELAMREHGIDWREVMSMYLAEPRGPSEPSPTSYYTTVSDR